MIGREAEIADIVRLAARHRLITLTGMGGVGKTRLAIAAARALAASQNDGAGFCDLSTVTEPAMVPEMLASALEVPERADATATEALRDFLHDKQVLFVLDNCEHLLEASGRLIGDLLTACPDLRVLATSREPLQAPGEVVWTVAPLGLPDPRSTRPALVSRAPAVQLFMARAGAGQPGFSLDARNAKTIAALCTRLDGIPLAIELCAARVRALPPDELLLRLQDRLDLLTTRSGAVPSRQRTMQASLDWSYELLDDAERALLRRLSVFAGSFDVDAVVGICVGGPVPDQPLNVLGALVDKSLVSTLPPVGGRARFRLLETIRQFLGDRLRENRESEQMRTQHARHFLAVAEQAEREIELSVQSAVLERLGADHANFRAALEWSAIADPPQVPRLAAALRSYWQIRGHYAEGRQWLATSLEMETRRTALRSRLLRADGLFAWRQGQFAMARRRLEEALAIERRRDDKPSLAYALGGLGFVLFGTEDFQSARPLFEEELALAREVAIPALLGVALQHNGILALQLGQLREARSHYEEALRVFRSLEDSNGVAYVSQLLALVLIQEGELKPAAQLSDDAVRLQVQLRDTAGLAGALSAAAELAAAQGRQDRAMTLDGAVEARLNAVGSHRPSLHKASRERWLSAAQLKLGPRARSLAERGARLSDEQVVAFALSGSDQPSAASTTDDQLDLTSRELEIGSLLATGLTYRQIAAKLHVSERTIDAHAEHIRNKLGVRSRAEIAAWMAARPMNPT